MSSVYFQQFLAQLTADGHKKADGYDLSLFKKLSASELAEAEELLIAALDKGDWNGIDALCLIGSEKAVEALKIVFGKVAENRFLKFKLAVYLFNKTHDTFYEQYLHPDFYRYDDTDRLSFIRGLPDLKTGEDYEATLMKSALTDKSKVCRFYSGVSLLKIKHVIKKDEELESYRSMLSKLAAESEQTRKIGVEELKKLFVAHAG